MGGLLVIPLVALGIPILLFLAAIVFDAVFVSWMAYRLWRDHHRTRLGRLAHRSS